MIFKIFFFEIQKNAINTVNTGGLDINNILKKRKK
jgi:hypothetical protein